MNMNLGKFAAMFLLLLFLALPAYANLPPLHSGPALYSSSGMNYTTDSIICENQSTTDPDGDSVSNNFDFRENGASFAALNLPFNTNVSSTGAGEVRDYSSYENNGTLGAGVPASSPVWTALGKAGGAYLFDGTNDIISIPDSPSLDGDGAWGAFSAEAWINSGEPDQALGIMLAKRAASGARSYQLGFDSVQAGRIFCGFYLNGAYAEAPAAGTPLIEPGQWYHVACTYRNSEGIKLYINGSLVSTNAAAGLVTASAGVPLKIGARNTGTADERFFNGAIDEVRIYGNRTLSPEEIAAHAALGYNSLPPQALSAGSSYSCEVTPSDGIEDGASLVSNQLTVSDPPPAQPGPAIEIISPQPISYGTNAILVNISSTGAYTWFFNGTENESYLSPVYRDFPEGENTLYAWANDSNGTVNSTSVSFTVDTSPEPNYDDVFFDSSFESGNLYNVQSVSGDAAGNRLYSAQINYSTTTYPDSHWWFFFKMSNASGKNIRINITNISSADFSTNRWQNARPRLSYDYGIGNVNPADTDWSAGSWSGIPASSISYSSSGLWYSFNLAPEQDAVWIAPSVPYTYTRMNQFLASISANPHAALSAIAVSPKGRAEYAITITDSAYPDGNKTRIYITGQQHANTETQGSWAIEGAMGFLLNDTNETAALLRRNYIFRFVPIFNVDGTYEGVARYTPVYSGNLQYDTNRQWDDARLQSSGVYALVNITYQDIGAFSPASYMDWHGSINGESGFGIPPGINYFLHDGNYDSAMANFLTAIAARWEYLYPNYNKPVNSQAAPPNVRLGWGVHPSTTIEWSVTNVSANELPDNLDWASHGQGLALAMDDYYNNRANEPNPDPYPPSVEIIEPAADATVNGTIAIRANATDEGMGISSVSYKIDSGSYVPMSLAGGLYEATWNTSLYANGPHTITVLATDNNGNQNASAVSVNVQNPVPMLVLAVTTGSEEYSTGQTVSTQTVVRDGEGSPVSGASAVVRIYKSNGALAKQCTGSTPQSGILACNGYKIKRNDPRGIWWVNSTATKSGYLAGNASASFRVI